jgi:gliding motility-associated-like protein
MMFIGIPLHSQSNEGTEFWFTFLEHRDQTNNRVCMITSKYNATGIIEMPSTGWSQNVNITANTVQIISIPGQAEMLSNETVDETAVRVTMNVPSSVYIHQYHEYRSDATLVLPVPALGTEYYIMSYTPYQTDGIHYPSEFAIVSVEDETEIELNNSVATESGRPKGSTWKIQLNKGKTYQVHGATSNDDLTGTHLKANKPICVFSGNRWTQVPRGKGNRDNLLEQMPPVDSWGREFVMVSTKNTVRDIYRFLSATDGNIIEIYNKGNVLNQSFTLNKGNWREIELDSSTRYVRSSQPILLAQFLVGGDYNGHKPGSGPGPQGIGDPAMVVLNSLEQYRDTVTLYNSPFEFIIENYINIVMKSRDTSTFLLDGLPLLNYNARFRTIGPNDEFAFAQIDVNSGPHTLIGGGCGVIAIAYGYGYAESYAYGGGANYTKINRLPIPDGGCLNDTIIFKTGLPENRYAVEWDFGNGNHSTMHNDTQSYHQLGKYTVKLKYTNLCLNTTDSVSKDIFITLRRDLIASGDTIVCVGDSVFLRASDKPGAKYYWTGTNHYFSIEQNPILANITKIQEGVYLVEGTLLGCASYPGQVVVEVNINPVPDLGKDTFYCSETGYISLKPGLFSSYTWQDGYSGSDYIVRKEGEYAVKVEDTYGCLGYDTVFVAEKCPVRLYVPNAFSPNGDNINDFFKPVLLYYTAYKLEIFDRWGDLLFQTDDPETGWNGRVNDQAAMPAVYVYVIHYSGYDEFGSHHNNIKAGDFTLVR